MCPSNAQAWSAWVQASDVPLFSLFISGWKSDRWRKSLNFSLKCFHTKPIKRIMQIVWKCAPLTVWTATDTQTIALWSLVLLWVSNQSCAIVWLSLCLGAFLETDLILIQRVLVLLFPFACPKRKSLSGCKDASFSLVRQHHILWKFGNDVLRVLIYCTLICLWAGVFRYRLCLPQQCHWGK